MRIATYLQFGGNCADALDVYKELFDADVICKHLYDAQMTADERLVGKVFHAELKIREFYIYMSDAGTAYDYDKQACKITVECDSMEQAQRYFETLSSAGQVLQPLSKMPYGPTIGQLRDAFGTTWDIVYCK